LHVEIHDAVNITDGFFDDGRRRDGHTHAAACTALNVGNHSVFWPAYKHSSCVKCVLISAHARCWMMPAQGSSIEL
jgi:hypothetical protein